MANETSRRYLFVAIRCPAGHWKCPRRDRATRWVFIGIYNNKTAANARRFLRDLERACPLRIRTILTELPMIAPMVRATLATVRSLLTVSLACASV
jgi:hypothetical protein